MDWMHANPYLTILGVLAGWLVLHLNLSRRNDVLERAREQQLELQREVVIELRHISNALSEEAS